MSTSTDTSSFDKFRLPLILLAVLILPIILGQYVPIEIKSFFFGLSLTMKSFLVMALPFMIFSFLFYSLISLGSGALIFVILLLATVATSNFIAIMTGYIIGLTAIPLFELDMTDPGNETSILYPLFHIMFPTLIKNEPALFFGILAGLIFGLKPNEFTSNLSMKLNHYCITFLRKFFLPVLPIFILGFVFKLEYENILAKIWHVYGHVLFIIVSSQLAYIIMIYLIAANFSPKKFLTYIRNILPATITGFSTISSVATMPVTILCTEKNLNNVAWARTIIPATANIHTLGSAIGLTILCLSTIMAFGLEMPSFDLFIRFAIFYTIAKFAVAGIPGGVVIVVSPLLEAYLGFSPEMVGLITAVYMLFDPFGTAANVTCNGAFAIIFGKIYKMFNKTSDLFSKTHVKSK